MHYLWLWNMYYAWNLYYALFVVMELVLCTILSMYYKSMLALMQICGCSASVVGLDAILSICLFQLQGFL
jgi:hypothetical protein